MSYNWGPHYIVPTKALKEYSGSVSLREQYDDELLRKDLEELGMTGPVLRVSNPWYFRKKGSDTWIKAGESASKEDNFSVRWDTTTLKNGRYEILGMMHVYIKYGDEEKAIARSNTVEVQVKN